MPINVYNPNNILALMSLLSPTLITFFLVMLSLFNLKFLKGLYYLAGGLLTIGVSDLIGLSDTDAANNQDTDTKLQSMCGLITPLIPGLPNYKLPSTSTMYLSYTLMYLFLPMIYYSNINIALVSALLVMISIDIVIKIKYKCTHVLGSFTGLLLGLVMGMIWCLMPLMSSKDEWSNILYYEDFGTNKPFCVRSKTKFKCNVAS